MNVLESPVEALAFNYVSFGFFTLVNNLWTWIAFITAAVSFWRIRVAGAGEFRTEVSLPIDDRSSPAPEDEKPSPIPSLPEMASVPTHFVEEMAATRGSRKFVLHYDHDSDGDDEMTAMGECDGGGKLTVTEEEQSEWFAAWDRALMTRRGESVTAGWYRYQDLTELNGSVVRLWDDAFSNRKIRLPKRSVLW